MRTSALIIGAIILAVAIIFTSWKIIAVATPVELFISVETSPNDDPTTINEIVTAINSVATQYPEVRGVAFSTGDAGIAYAYAMDKAIVFNVRYTSNRRLLVKSIDNDVRLKFHPPLGHCSAAEFLAFHESAHVLHRARGVTYANTQIYARYGNGERLRGHISNYSFNVDIAPNEALAEAFAAVKCGGGNWAEKELYTILTGENI